MTTQEYALIKDGEIENVVTTSKSLTTLREEHPEYKVMPLVQVDWATKRRYRFWEERP